MAIWESIDQYTDGNDLVAPHPMRPGELQGSGNGVMYTAEYFIILNRSLKWSVYAQTSFLSRVSPCIDSNGLLNRYPLSQISHQEGPDDYYGVLSACKELGITSIPRQFMSAVNKYWGFLNNENPGKWTKNSFLIRQPALLACMVAAAYPSLKNPLHYLIRLAFFPFFLVTSLIISTSCMFTETDNSDSRRVAWHVIQATKSASLFCKLASLIWYKRLYEDYGPTGMKAVATIYYEPHGSHPFALYWID